MRIDQYEFKEMPDRDYKVEKGIVFICMYDGIAEFQCPCGCNNIVILNLLPELARPLWKVQGNTITPSVNRIGANCRSHFNITGGKVIWS